MAGSQGAAIILNCADPVKATVKGLGHAAHGLGPAEWFFDRLSAPLGIAVLAEVSSAGGGGPPGLSSPGVALPSVCFASSVPRIATSRRHCRTEGESRSRNRVECRLSQQPVNG